MNNFRKVTPGEIKKCRDAQEYYVKKRCTSFAPRDGVCYRCNRNIYQHYELSSRVSKGYSLDKSSNSLITGCPHCCISYCD